VYDRPVPTGLGSIEDWLLQYIYDHPHHTHSTISLLQQLDQALRDEPSQLDECNRIRGIMGAAALSAEECAALRKPERGAVLVRDAVEIRLSRAEWAKTLEFGDRNARERGLKPEDVEAEIAAARSDRGR
jgi:hypothetical protein